MAAPMGSGVPGRSKGRPAEVGKGLEVLRDEEEVHQDPWGDGSMAVREI